MGTVARMADTVEIDSKLNGTGEKQDRLAGLQLSSRLSPPQPKPLPWHGGPNGYSKEGIPCKVRVKILHPGAHPQGTAAECGGSAGKLGDGRGGRETRSEEGLPGHEGRYGLRQGQEAGCFRGQIWGFGIQEHRLNVVA